MSGVRVEVDSVHGGRWVSLTGPDGKEWLWRRDAPEREAVRPGDPFVDAGGLEECYPTIGGQPDHGAVWSRPWQVDDAGLRVHGDDFDLHRTIRVEGDEVVGTYRLLAPPGQRFVWAAHALLALSTAARVELPAGHPMTVDLPDRSETAAWPLLDGADLSVFGPADGTVMGIRLPDLSAATVVDGDSRLTLALEVDGQPVGVMLWRNLGGWPEAAPYRSTGVEPMIGHRATLANAGPREAGVVPTSGEVSWTLRIAAS
jgi:hypothetical protein